MKKLVVGLLSAAAVATTLLIVRQQQEDETLKRVTDVPGGERHSSRISLERIRELGL